MPKPKVQDAYDGVIYDPYEAVQALKSEPGWTALDLETGGLSPWKDPIAVFSLYGETSGQSAVIHARGVVPPVIRDYLSDPSHKFVSHNGAGFDYLFLANNGVDINGPQLYDTMIGEACTIVSQRRDVRVNLQDTLRRRLGVSIKKGLGTSPWMSPELTEEQLKYCVEDIQFLPRLMHKQVKDASVDTRADAIKFEQTLAPVVVEMVMNGLPFDEAALDAYQKELEVAAEEANERLYTLWGALNYNSPKQVKEAFNGTFTEELEEPLESTDKLHMNELAATKAQPEEVEAGSIGQAAEDVLRVRAALKGKGMYSDEWIGKYLHEGRVHPRLWQVGTDTGRFSSSEPNLQQVPKKGRKIFVAPEGYSYFWADYTGLEVVVAGVLAGDDVLLADMLTGDMHTQSAANIFGVAPEAVTPDQRRLAKSGSFTLMFVGSPPAMVRAARMRGQNMTLQVAKEIQFGFYQRYKGLSRMHQQARRIAANSMSRTITLPTGIKRQLTSASGSLTPQRIVNTVVQGTAAAGLKHSMMLCKQAGLMPYIGCVVHDEILGCAPTHMAEECKRELERCMVEGMREVLDYTVMVDGSIDKSWH